MAAYLPIEDRTGGAAYCMRAAPVRSALEHHEHDRAFFHLLLAQPDALQHKVNHAQGPAYKLIVVAMVHMQGLLSEQCVPHYLCKPCRRWKDAPQVRRGLPACRWTSIDALCQYPHFLPPALLLL